LHRVIDEASKVPTVHTGAKKVGCGALDSGHSKPITRNPLVPFHSGRAPMDLHAPARLKPNRTGEGRRIGQEHAEPMH